MQKYDLVNWKLKWNINPRHSHKKKKSLEIWAVKLQFLLIYENILKSIATVRSECIAKLKNKAIYNTDYIVPDLTHFFGYDWKAIKTQIAKRNFYICKNYCNN